MSEPDPPPAEAGADFCAGFAAGQRARSEARLVLLLGLVCLFLAWLSLPGFVPPGTPPSLWPWIFFVSGPILLGWAWVKFALADL